MKPSYQACVRVPPATPNYLPVAVSVAGVKATIDSYDHLV